MLKKLKMLFTNMTIDSNSIEYKIKYLENININPYSLELMDIGIQTITIDIINAIKEISNILNTNYKNDYLNIKDIHTSNILDKSITEWFTDDGNIIVDTHIVWLEWLAAVGRLIELHTYLSKNVENHYAHGNAMRMQPYITDSKHIIITLYEHYKNI